MRYALYFAPTLIALAVASMGAPTQERLRLRLLAPPDVRAGTTVPFTFRIENATDNPIDLYLRGRAITFDIVVTRNDGRVVWRRLEGEIIPAIVQLRTLAPREALEVHAEWDQRDNGGRLAGPGLYEVRGALLTDAATPLETATVPLRITPR